MAGRHDVHSTIKYYVDGRLFEWVLDLSMLILGLQSMFWPKTMLDWPFQWVTAFLGPTFIVLFMLIAGWIRFVGLSLNGHRVFGVVVGPIIRSITAVFCAMLWAQFAYAGVLFTVVHGYPPPALPFWVMFTLGEFYVAYRAVGSNGQAT